jgi:hypothetical protein
MAESPARDLQAVIECIRDAFHATHHPGDAFLQGSHEGCEPAEVTAPFKGMAHWSTADPAMLDANYTALSFFSEGAFRHFLPAFLIADLQGQLRTADPLFHLTNGFSDQTVSLPAGTSVFEKAIGRSAFVNPRRYGAMTWYDYARAQLSVFTREEAGAIVAYLECKRDADSDGINRGGVQAALDGFWLERARTAPTQAMLNGHLKAEAEYISALTRR